MRRVQGFFLCKLAVSCSHRLIINNFEVSVYAFACHNKWLGIKWVKGRHRWEALLVWVWIKFWLRNESLFVPEPNNDSEIWFSSLHGLSLFYFTYDCNKVCLKFFFGIWEATLHKIRWFTFTWSQYTFSFNLGHANVVDQTHSLFSSFTHSKKPPVWVYSQRGYALTALNTFTL